MKKIQAMMLIVVSLVIFLVGYREMKPVSDQEKMESMIAALEKNGTDVQRWSWLARETKEISNIHTFEKELKQLKERADLEEWQIEKSKDGYKAIAQKKFSSYEERLVVTWTMEY